LSIIGNISLNFTKREYVFITELHSTGDAAFDDRAGVLNLTIEYRNAVKQAVE